MSRHAIEDMGQPGDIILYPTGGGGAWSSRLVAAGEILVGMGRGLEVYSHAAILDSPGYQYEATFPRTGRFKIDTKRVYEVWRIGKLTDGQRERILLWCKAHVGRWYNLLGVLTGGIIELPGTYYCSQFAGRAYQAAGLGIGDEIMSPSSIPDSEGAKMVYRFTPERRRGTR